MASLQLTIPIKQSHRRTIRCDGRRELFDRIAPVYDNLNDLLSLGQHRVWKRMAVAWCGAKPGDNVLDVCCGSGDISFLLSEKVGGNGHVYGLDFSRSQLAIAAEKQRKCYDNIVWIEGNALDLPFPDNYFDAVTIGYGLRNVPDAYVTMTEINRVLKQGSKVSVLDINKSVDQTLTLFQGWMIDNVVVPVASNYGLGDEYKYLKRSIEEFKTGKELEKLGLDAGFSSAKHYEIGFGLMGCLVATR